MISCGGTTTRSCCPLTRLRSAPWTRRGHYPFCGYRGPPLNPSRIQLPVRLRQGTETVRPGASIPESAEPAPTTPVAPQKPDVASEAAPEKTKATRAKKAPRRGTDSGTPADVRARIRTDRSARLPGGTLRFQPWVLAWYSRTPRRKRERREVFSRVRAQDASHDGRT